MQDTHINLDMQRQAESNQGDGQAAPTVKQVCMFCESHPVLVSLVACMLAWQRTAVRVMSLSCKVRVRRSFHAKSLT